MKIQTNTEASLSETINKLASIHPGLSDEARGKFESILFESFVVNAGCEKSSDIPLKIKQENEAIQDVMRDFRLAFPKTIVRDAEGLSGNGKTYYYTSVNALRTEASCVARELNESFGPVSFSFHTHQMSKDELSCGFTITTPSGIISDNHKVFLSSDEEANARMIAKAHALSLLFFVGNVVTVDPKVDASPALQAQKHEAPNEVSAEAAPSPAVASSRFPAAAKQVNAHEEKKQALHLFENQLNELASSRSIAKDEALDIVIRSYNESGGNEKIIRVQELEPEKINELAHGVKIMRMLGMLYGDDEAKKSTRFVNSINKKRLENNSDTEPSVVSVATSIFDFNNQEMTKLEEHLSALVKKEETPKAEMKSSILN